jgi:HNH endonuclease
MLRDNVCSVHGCVKIKKKKHSMCSMHCERKRLFGTVTLPNPPDTRPVVERIMDMVAMVPECGCWLWLGPGNPYGQIGIRGEGAPTSVHRVMWEHENGPIPDGMFVLHKCDIGLCCNPNHLFLGTQQDNMTDKVNKQRQARGEKMWNALLTEPAVIEIRESSLPYAVLAEKFGVSKRAIKAVRTRQNWKHVA